MLSQLAGVPFVSCKLTLLSSCRRDRRLCSSWRLRRGCRLCCIRIGHTWTRSAFRVGDKASVGLIPSRALKAGSRRPLLARRTALTTAASIEGKASLRVVSACCSGAMGRGGLGGATSSPEPGCGSGEVGGALGGDVSVSVGSSSKSKALAVVGDSGRSSTFYNIVSSTLCNQIMWCCKTNRLLFWI